MIITQEKPINNTAIKAFKDLNLTGNKIDTSAPNLNKYYKITYALTSI